MKIEKISDNQIRCILTGDDLRSRQLKLSELAYGTQKARELFRDLMQQAAWQCGFNAENIPLMIEAIPMAEGSIVLIVTKVENPEELDTRFSSFAPSVQEMPGGEEREHSIFDQLIETIRKSAESSEFSGLIAESSEGEAPVPAEQPAADAGQPQEVPEQDAHRRELERVRTYLMLNRLFIFEALSDLVEAAKSAAPFYQGESDLYQDSVTGMYYLILTMHTPDEVSSCARAMAALSEYGAPEMMLPARRSQITEHSRCVKSGHVLAELAQV